MEILLGILLAILFGINKQEKIDKEMNEMILENLRELRKKNPPAILFGARLFEQGQTKDLLVFAMIIKENNCV